MAVEKTTNGYYTLGSIGDSIIIKLTNAYANVESVTGFSDVTIGETTDSDILKEFRWGTDGENFSEFITLTNLNLGALTLDSSKEFWIEYRYSVEMLSTGNTFQFNSIALEVVEVAGTITEAFLENYQGQSGVELDPYATQSSSQAGGGTGTPSGLIISECNKEDYFDPYATGAGNNMYLQLSNMVSDIFGHAVKYYRVAGDVRAQDVILKEYSLYNIKGMKEVNIMVPDNEFPTRAASFNVFGMEWEDFEVHITKYEYQTAFGKGTRPRVRDYLYFPIIDTMWEVSSVALADEFNMQSTYYRVMLTKYQKRATIDNVVISAGGSSGLTVDQTTELDKLVTTIDEVINVDKGKDYETQEQEFDKITHPKQYDTIGAGKYDFVRSELDKKVKIVDYKINNNWTIISKNYYALNEIKPLTPNSVLSVFYKKKINIATTDNRAFTFWFKSMLKPTRSQNYNKYITLTSLSDSNGYLQITFDTNIPTKFISVGDRIQIAGTTDYNTGLHIVKEITTGEEVILETTYTGNAMNGGKARIKEEAHVLYGRHRTSPDTNKGFDIKVYNGFVIVKINNTEHLFNLENKLAEWDANSADSVYSWYGATINLNHEFSQLGVYIYKLDKSSNISNPSAHDTGLSLVYDSTISITPTAIATDDVWMLVNAPIHFTNLRIFNRCIEEEQHNLVLNQYIVRDSQHALLVDNAIPSVKLMKLSNPN